LGTLIRLCMRIISSGTAVCVAAVLMVTDNGVLKEGEEVVAVAGSWVGLGWIRQLLCRRRIQ